MKRAPGRSLGNVAAAAAATLLAAGVAAAPAGAATTTHTSTVPVPIGQTSERGVPADANIGINDAFISGPGKASPYPAVAAVTGLVGTVSEVTVRIGSFSHQYPQDVDIMLVSPATSA